jgi:hypothetical protein
VGKKPYGKSQLKAQAGGLKNKKTIVMNLKNIQKTAKASVVAVALGVAMIAGSAAKAER